MPLPAGDHLIAEALANRAVLATLARAVIKGRGSEAFVWAEAQAIKFATPNDGRVKPEISQQAERIVKEIFQMADGVPGMK